MFNEILKAWRGESLLNDMLRIFDRMLDDTCGMYDKVTSWLFSIAHHRTIDELRRRRRAQSQVQDGVDLTNKPSDGADDPVAYATAQYERSQLKDALHTLRVEQREVVVLAYFGGLTHSEIAKHLDQPLGTVKTRMRLGLRRMREALGPQVQESAGHGL